MHEPGSSGAAIPPRSGDGHQGFADGARWPVDPCTPARCTTRRAGTRRATAASAATAVMLIVCFLITLVSWSLASEIRGRDPVGLEDAA